MKNWKRTMKNYYLPYLLVFTTCVINANGITGSTVWNLDSTNIIGESSSIDRLGEAVSYGDYNGDGFQDLAIGIPNYDFEFLFGTINNTGTVLIIYGSPTGLSTSNEQFLFQTFESDPANLENSNGVEANDFFGKSLASGDFNCDGFTDLAVGTPDESVTIDGELRNNVGAINIFYGSDVGFADLGAGSTFLFQYSGTTPLTLGFLEEGDRFGWSMTVGNFNGDADIGNDHECHDLAVSSPFEDFGPNNDAGMVSIFYGSESNDISHSGQDVLTQADINIDGEAQSGDQFGLSLASGESSVSLQVGSRPFSFLAIGIPGKDIDGQADAGAVQVFKGSAEGLKPQGEVNETIWSQSGDIVGLVEANDRFGSSLATGDFNNDRIDDLAIGVPREDINASGINDAGSVNIIYGNTFGLSSSGNQSFHENTANVGGSAETSDWFGSVLTAGDLNNDQYDDLVIGVPRENSSRGAFHVLHGSSNGVTTSEDIYESNIFAQVLEEFSFALTVADFGKGEELVVGIPGDNSGDGDNQAGSVEVFEFEANISDLIFANSFEDLDF